MKKKVAGLVERPLADEGFELADVVVSRYRNDVTLKLFVYRENGVSISDCTRLSRVVGEVLDGAKMYPDGYALEVSSPGLDRPLKTAVDYRYRVGEIVKVDFVDKRRSSLKARIVSADEEQVALQDGETTITLPLAAIDSAKIVF